MKEDLKNILLMGLGAMSLTSDKAKEIKKELLEKGSKLYEEGKITNEELKHNIEDKIKDSVTVVVNKDNITKEDIIEKINSMTSEEKESIKKALNEKKNNKNE